MSGFGVSNITKLERVNEFCKTRGPDLTTIKIVNDVQFLHNLLHITGEFTPQPFINGDVACVLDGEIYNYKSFGNYKSDGECILDLYSKEGELFVKQLDGEFALCLIDFAKNKIIIANDTFGCKPLWYEFTNENFVVASYNSQLIKLGLTQGNKLKSNTTKVYNLRTLTQTNQYQNQIFNLNQHKTNFDDWIDAFQLSISKRTQNTKQGIFIGLSSGYDSGAIACEFTKQNIDFKGYSITSGVRNYNENKRVLDERCSILKNTETIDLHPAELIKWQTELINNCEEFTYYDSRQPTPGRQRYNIVYDHAAMGLCEICHRANNDKLKIYFSGHGADEIFADYGFGGKNVFKVQHVLHYSQFGGLFPTKLEGFFPWHSFWDGTQMMYLNKEEYVSGHFGIETRYPFLDSNLIQEFLWLDSKLKNSNYKSVLHEYLTVNNFPFNPRAV